MCSNKSLCQDKIACKYFCHYIISLTMAALVAFLLFLLRFSVFNTLAESSYAVHDISLTNIKNLIDRVTVLEKRLQEERDQRMDLEREVATMAKENEDTINSLKVDFNNKITHIENQISDTEAEYTEDKIVRPTISKPLSERKDNSLCAKNQFKAVHAMFFSKFCRNSIKRSDGFEINEVDRFGKNRHIWIFHCEFALFDDFMKY